MPGDPRSSAVERSPSFDPFGTDYLGSVFWEMDGDLRLTYLSDCFFSLFSVKRDDLIGASVPQAAERMGVPAESMRLLNDHLNRRTPFRDQTLRARSRDGTCLTMVASGDPRQCERGNFAGFSGGLSVCATPMDYDCAPVETQMTHLRMTLARMRDFLDVATDYMWETDTENRFVYFSKGIETLFGDESKQFLGRSRLELIQDADKAALSRHLVLLANRKAFHDFRYWRRRMNGDMTCVSVSGRPYFDAQGDFAGYRGAARDVTDTELARQALVADRDAAARDREAAQAESAAKTAFLADLNHEIRNPLNGMLGVAALIRHGGPLTEKQERYLDMIDSSGRDVMGLLEPLKDISRLEDGECALTPAPTQLAQLCQDQVEPMKAAAAEKGLDLRLSMGVGLPPVVMADTLRLGQILANLLSNAVKFTETGGIEMQVEGTQPGWIRFTVSDTGPGVPAQERRKIFRRHHRVALDAAPPQPGSGLGLAICANLVQRMGGWIDVTENPGGGSVFWFEIPLEPAPEPAAST